MPGLPGATSRGQLLRDERDRIPAFIEQTLRLESPVKSDFRLARTSTTLGGVQIPAGTTIMVANGAVNRDPGRVERPGEFRIDRPNVREHLAFGRGVHSCPGGPLARVETRVSIERFLDRMAGIQISEAEHGPASARRHTYEPTHILRGAPPSTTNTPPRHKPRPASQLVGVNGGWYRPSSPARDLSRKVPGERDEL